MPDTMRTSFLILLAWGTLVASLTYPLRTIYIDYKNVNYNDPGRCSGNVW